MRLTEDAITIIRGTVDEIAGPASTVRLFGSRLNNDAAGGDVDLLVELKQTPENPAWLSAQVAGHISRRMHGRKVDVLLLAPGLRRLPIHEVALREGVLL